MTTVNVRRQDGSQGRDLDLDAGIFGVQPNVPVMHQVVTAQLAAARSGTHSTKTRSEVSGGGKKPWRQKGTGKARQGSIRAPHWVGGGVAMGPKPRDYRQKTPKKMVQLALRSALSDRAAEGKIVVVEAWNFTAPKTREGIAALSALGLTGKVLIVLSRDDEMAYRTFRNIPNVHLLLDTELNAYDVLCSDVVVFTEATVPAKRPSGDEAVEQTPPPAVEASSGGTDEEVAQ